MPKRAHYEKFTAEPLKRFGAFEREGIDEEKRTIPLSFSSEVELERWPGCFEVLSHDAGACDLSRLNSGAPLLFNHNPDKYIGVIESAEIGQDRKGRAVVRFSESEEADEIFNDVKAGILRNVSVGYRIKQIKLDETRDDIDRYLVGGWQPFEVSIVTIPADTSVGVGRSAESTSNLPVRKIMNRAQLTALLQKRGITVNESHTDDDLARMVIESEPAKVDPTGMRSEGANSEKERVKAIFAAGDQYGQRELAQEHVLNGGSLESFRMALLEAVDKQNKKVKDATSPLGLSDKEIRGFSLLRMFRALSAENASDRKKYSEQAKFELEACDAAASKMHRSVNGTVIPTDILLSSINANEAAFRANEIISIKTGAGYISTGGTAVPTTLLSGSLIDVLRNKAKLLGLCSELSGLVGNLDIPKKIDASTATWVGEDTAGDRQAVNFGLVSLRPKTVTNYAEITRKMMMQTSIGIEALVREDLMAQLGLEIDRVGFYGTGTGNQPTGIKNTSGVGSVTFAVSAKPTFAELVEMETLVALANADVDGMAYVANARLRGYAKTARKLSTATDSTTLWEPGNTINGYKTEITNQITTGDVFMGNFKDLVLGLWGGLEVTVDPYTHSTLGRIRIVMMQDVDFAIRRAASFVFGTT